MQQLSAPKISHLPYHGSFLPLDNRSKNNVWSCNFPGTFILQEPQTQIYQMDFLKLRIKDRGLLVAANSNVLYQFQWSTVSPLNVPSFLLVRACYGSTLTFSASAGCTLSNALPLLGHMLGFISGTVAWMTVSHFQWWDQVPSSHWDCILMSSGRDFFPSSVEILLADYFQIT